MRTRRMAAMVVAGALLVGLPACGKKTDEAARAAGITPADALGFVTFSLDPSIEQKRNLYNIARRFPDAEAKDDFTKTKEDLLAKALQEAGLDYQRDVEPWLGSEVAVAVLPAAAGAKAPGVAVFIEQDDREKAQAALDKANQKAGADGGQPVRYRFIDEFVVAAGTEDEAEANAVLDAIEAQAKAKQGDLASSPAFTEVVDKLRGDRLFLGWVNAEEVLKTVNEFLSDGNGGSPFDFSAALKEAGPTAFDLHAGDGSIVFEGVAKAKQPAAGGAPKLTESAPADSFGALTVFDLGKMVRDALAAVKSRGDDPTAAFEDETGIDLEVDILAWMGGESVLVSAPAPGGRALPDFGFVVEPTDRAAAEAAVARIAAAVEDRQDIKFRRRTIAGANAYVFSEEQDGVQPAFALFADRFVVATTPAYLEKLATASSPSLSSTSTYQSVLGSTSSSNTRFQLVLDIDAVREAVEKALGTADSPEYDTDVKPNLVPLDAFGLVARRDGDYERFEMKLTFD